MLHYITKVSSQYDLWDDPHLVMPWPGPGPSGNPQSPQNGHVTLRNPHKNTNISPSNDFFRKNSMKLYTSIYIYIYTYIQTYIHRYKDTKIQRYIDT